MRGSMKKMALVLALVAGLGSIGMAQVPRQTTLYFNVNVPYAVRMGSNLVLAPGKYILRQDSQDPELFGLYAGSLTQAPIAQILTNQTPYWSDRNRGRTEVQLRIDEHGPQPVLKGWTVPFADRFNIVSVVAKPDAFITRVQ